FRFGLQTRLLREPPLRGEPGLTVIDTDSRLLEPGDAAKIVARFVSPVARDRFDLVFKKTDSVFRGPVLAELDALSLAFDRRTILLVAQNPSRGRTIHKGE